MRRLPYHRRFPQNTFCTWSLICLWDLETDSYPVLRIATLIDFQSITKKSNRKGSALFLNKLVNKTSTHSTENCDSFFKIPRSISVWRSCRRSGLISSRKVDIDFHPLSSFFQPLANVHFLGNAVNRFAVGNQPEYDSLELGEVFADWS